MFTIVVTCVICYQESTFSNDADFMFLESCPHSEYLFYICLILKELTVMADFNKDLVK